ncbi:MAG TPA: hypothetical protein VK600_04655 [Candidatus Saccharimonadales bacterium]|nr:hypothetical protein [Candidatus Saccharimonadales bacterium]
MSGARIASVLTLVLVGVAGCRVAAPAASTATTMPTASALASAMPALPSNFPVLAGLTEDPPKSDPGLIASWTTAISGPRVYEFYLSALPAAGYRIEGLFPGGAVAIVRCRAAGDAIWQVVITGDPMGMGTRIELRLDRP